MDHPKFVLVFLKLWGGEFCYEVSQCLSFYGCSGAIFYIKLAKLNGPLYHPSSSFRFIHCFLDRLVHHYYDWVNLEIWVNYYDWVNLEIQVKFS